MNLQGFSLKNNLLTLMPSLAIVIEHFSQLKMGIIEGRKLKGT